MDDFRLSPAQGLQILAIAEMLRSAELSFIGEEKDLAYSALIDASQEIALQINLEE